MLTCATIAEVRSHIAAARRLDKRVGLVPTMGALHWGHLSLVTSAREACDFVVVTIFVNPLQFAPHEDLEKYPRPLARDLELCGSSGADLVFHPEPAEMYLPAAATQIQVSGISAVLEGEVRPTHYTGVATVVQKLFGIVQPDAAYFGEKDYQQLLVIRRMVADLNTPVEVIGCRTVRDDEGLALSSRNVYLSPEERLRALSLSRALRAAREALDSGRRDFAAIEDRMQQILLTQGQAKIDYATIRHPDTLGQPDPDGERFVILVAARIGATRLIDNMQWP